MKITHEKAKCIGCGICTQLCPELFEMGADGKAHLKDSEYNPNTEVEEREVESSDCAKEAAESCPVQCIHIEKGRKTR